MGAAARRGALLVQGGRPLRRCSPEVWRLVASWQKALPVLGLVPCAPPEAQPRAGCAQLTSERRGRVSWGLCAAGTGWCCRRGQPHVGHHRLCCCQPLTSVPGAAAGVGYRLISAALKWGIPRIPGGAGQLGSSLVPAVSGRAQAACQTLGSSPAETPPSCPSEFLLGP